MNNNKQKFIKMSGGISLIFNKSSKKFEMMWSSSDGSASQEKVMDFHSDMIVAISMMKFLNNKKN